jgi:hypothetical protein
MPAGGDDHIDILARVTTSLNTDLEGATRRWIGTIKNCRLLRLGLPIWKHNLLVSDPLKK